jgi:pyruvate/2-oxoglutarate dehydrogenase complex dihydrolipoamide acyltransferase (E2) component
MSSFKRASLVLMNQGGHLYEKNYSLVLRVNPRLSSLNLISRANSEKAAAAPKKPAEAPPKGTSYKNLTIGVPKETFLNEKRVAITPAVTQTLTKKGFKLVIEENAGQAAKFPNEDYEKAGGKITNASGIYSAADILLKVRAPTSKVNRFLN